MKLITGTKEAVEANVKAQFNFGARLVVYPRVDRWDPEGERLQSVRADGSLVPDVYTYTWQPAVKQGDDYVAKHIEDFGFNPSPMADLYPSDLFGEDGEAFLTEFGHLSTTEYVTQEIIDKDENITTITV